MSRFLLLFFGGFFWEGRLVGGGGAGIYSQIGVQVVAAEHIFPKLIKIILKFSFKDTFTVKMNI